MRLATIRAEPAPRSAHSDEISSEPLVRWLHSSSSVLGFGLAVLLLVYVSLLPFEFRWGRMPGSVSSVLDRLCRTSLTLSDVVANITLYVPFGALGYLAWRRRGFGVITSASVTMVVGGWISFGIEVVQVALPARVPSIIDVVCNLMGNVLGVALGVIVRPAIVQAAARMHRALRTNPWSVIAKCLACGLVLIELRPYDAQLSTPALARAARSAQLDPASAWRALNAPGVGGAGESELDPSRARRAQWDYALDRAGETAGYAVLAGATALAMQVEFGLGRVAAVAYGGFVSVVLSIVVTGARMLLISRGLDTLHPLIGLAGAALAAIVMMFVLSSSPATRDRRADGATEFRLPVRGLALGVGSAVAFVVLRGTAPMDFQFGSAVASTQCANWVPFAGHLGSKPNDALLDLSSKWLEFTVLGALVALWREARRRAASLASVREPAGSDAEAPASALIRHDPRWRAFAATATLGAIVLAAALQAAHRFLPSRTIDMTSIVLAAAGMFGGIVAVRWALDYAHANRARRMLRVANDLLTGQLIDGATYDKSSAITPRSSRSETSPMDRAESSRPV